MTDNHQSYIEKLAKDSQNSIVTDKDERGNRKPPEPLEPRTWAQEKAEGQTFADKNRDWQRSQGIGGANR